MKRKLGLSFLLLAASLLFILSVPVLPHSHTAAAQSASKAPAAGSSGGFEFSQQRATRRPAGNRRGLRAENY